MNIVLILASFHTDTGLSEAGRERARLAATLLHDDPDSMAIVTGGELAYGVAGPHHAYVTGELATHGIDAGRILAVLSDTAHTVDEAHQTQLALESVAYESLFVVTSFVHYPRAPFVFAHFFGLDKLHFVLAPDASAKDVTRFNYLHEVESYQEDRRRGGVVLRDGRFISTGFTYRDFTELLRNRCDIRIPGMKEHEIPVSAEMDLFVHYQPNSPFTAGEAMDIKGSNQ